MDFAADAFEGVEVVAQDFGDRVVVKDDRDAAEVIDVLHHPEVLELTRAVPADLQVLIEGLLSGYLV